MMFAFLMGVQCVFGSCRCLKIIHRGQPSTETADILNNTLSRRSGSARYTDPSTSGEIMVLFVQCFQNINHLKNDNRIIGVREMIHLKILNML